MEVEPKFLRNMCFANKYKMSLKKIQANNAKKMSVRAKVIKTLVKPKKVKAMIPKSVTCKLD